LETLKKELANLLMPLAEVNADLIEERAYSFFREQHDPFDDRASAFGVAGAERPEKDA
jgi:hypothetical protein